MFANLPLNTCLRAAWTRGGAAAASEITWRVTLLTLLAWSASYGHAAAQSYHRHAPAATRPDVSAAVPTASTPGPAVFENLSLVPGIVEVRLTAAPARLPLKPGTVTDVYAYNGRSPGPTLEVREGERVVVRFRNNLPEATTVHWHGLHLPFEADGSPFHPVAPGEEYEYAFTVRPGSAGTYWYHPHPHHHTATQVARGLYGAVIVRALDDPLPPTLTERLLILSDNRFLPDGSLDLADPHSPQGRMDFENGREGDVLFVSGEVMPTLGIRSGEVQRWRVINTSAGRFYRLAIPGHTFLHVGSDGGLFERAVEVSEILLASAERVELLVLGTGEPGSRAALQALPYDRYIPQTRPKDWNEPRDLLTLQYTNESPMAPTALPSVLRPIPALDPGEATTTRLMVMTQGMINGKLMDMDRIDVSAPLGATEIWEVENLVGLDHPFHLHGFQFQVLDRNGVPEPFRSWKDTVNVPKHQMVRFIVRYDNHPGKWMFHCHILDHEDHGMMGVLEVK
jgi:FtsP/CotA-like multicopper oxidase with cupredoxin domain